MRAAWRVFLDAAREEALLAVDLYNQPRQPRRLEAFLVHMHIAWLYLLHAEFKMDKVDIRYRLPNGRFDRVDGEPKTWDLAKCVSQRWPQMTSVRANLELTIGLRNKIEHRHTEATTLVTSGHAQAHLVNFEQELTAKFGDKFSLGEQLRFPIFVGNVTALGNAQFTRLKEELPATTKDFLARFESGIDEDILADQRYEFRMTLVPQVGPKTDADMALNFVREGDLSAEQLAVVKQLGRTGSVIVREQVRPVSNAELLRPVDVARAVKGQIDFEFKVHHVVLGWKKLECRPQGKSSKPERTTEKYCIYDRAHRDYLYTSAFVSKLIREAETEATFRAFFGSEPVQESQP